MSDEKQIKQSALRIVKDDITAMDVECFVYYAQSDLKLGSGFGSAISVRGGPSIQKELDKLGSIDMGEAVISDAGELKAKYIIHANGPKFQEENLEQKLKDTTLNVLKLADEKGISQIAMPLMGCGFYGIPLDVSAKVTLNTVKEYFEGNTNIKEVIFCANDNREFKPFRAQLVSLN